MFFRRKKVGPEYYFERGEECLNNGNYPWALESFTKALEFNPGLEMAYYRRAEAYRKLGKNREAVWDCIKFLETDRRQPDMAEDFKDAMKEAVKIARRGWEKDRVKEEIISFGIPGLIDELIEGYDPEGEYSDSHFYDLSLSNIDVSSPQNRYYTGFVHLVRKDFDEAIKEFDKAIEANPENPDAYYLRGAALIGKVKMIERKDPKSRSLEKVKELTDLAHSNFEEALKRSFKWRICPGCGYRTSSAVNYCMRCGTNLLAG